MRNWLHDLLLLLLFVAGSVALGDDLDREQVNKIIANGTASGVQTLDGEQRVKLNAAIATSDADIQACATVCRESRNQLTDAFPASAAAPAAPDSPDDITGLFAWYKSDSGTTLNGSDVSAWADQSGNGHNLAQANAGYQPTLVSSVINGFPAIRFEGPGVGGPDHLRRNTLVVPDMASWTIFFVVSTGAAQDTQERLLSIRDDATSRWCFSTGTSATSGLGFAPDNLGAGEAMSANTFYTRSYVRSSSEWDIWQNGTLVEENAASSSYPASTVDWFTIGAEASDATVGADASSLAGDIVEVIMYSAALSTSDRQVVETYLKNRYAHY